MAIGERAAGDSEGTYAGDRFRLSFRPRFADTDASGVVHFSRIFVFFEMIEAQFYRGLGYNFSSQARGGFYLARANAECQFLSPIRQDDRMIGEMRVAEVGNTHIKYEFHLLNESTGSTSAEGTVVVVSVDTRTWKKIPLAAKLLSTLEKARGQAAHTDAPPST